MIWSDTIMFTIPALPYCPGCINMIPCHLNMDSRKIISLLKKGYDRSSICNALFEIFSNIQVEILSKEIPQERKWWQFFKSRYITTYSYKNLDFKCNLLGYINGDSSLNDDDLRKVKLLYITLPCDVKKIIPLSFFEN